MIYKEAYIQLYINGNEVELESQDVNIRLNSVLYSPTEITSRQGEYSFSFDIPATPKNNIIFNFANDTQAINKFIRAYNAKMYADEHLLFDGSLTVNSYKDGKYNCNLVAIKAIDYDDIFGDTAMNELEWYIPFNGVVDLNAYNWQDKPEVCFPLVSYGAFQKQPKLSDDVGNVYSSKFDFDEYNRWYVETFYPSPNVMLTLKKCFEHKGYTVGGDAFDDEVLGNIYASINLSDDQDPLYNLGNPNFGRVSLALTATTSGSGYEQELAFPYFHVGMRGRFGTYTGETDAYNWQSVRIYDLLSMASSSNTIAMNQSPCYMYQPDEHIIVIPADGFYKIDLYAPSITQASSSYTVSQWVVPSSQSQGVSETAVTLSGSLLENTPFELHLVRNYEDDIELIKGKYNVEYKNGNPNTTTYYNNAPNKQEWLTCYPHEDPYNATLPTESNNLSFRNTNTRFGGSRANSGSETTTTGGSRSGSGNTGNSGFGRRNARSSWTGETGSSSRGYNRTSLGYVYKNDNTDIMAFDAGVNPNFICGLSTLHGGVASAIKNGRSWSATIGEENEAFYVQQGYQKMTASSNTITYENTEFNANTYQDAPMSTCYASTLSANGSIRCMVWLNKNDVIQLYGVQRAYDTTAGAQVNYSTTVQARLTIEAASPNSYALLRQKNFGYNSTSEFDYNLRIGNFMNKETSMSEWCQGIIDAFNFWVTVDGNNVFINKKNRFTNGNTGIVNIDGKANSKDAEIKPIDYPKSMAVRYKIDTEEYGFEKTVDDAHINLDDWYKYGDSGYSVIHLSDMEGASEQNLDLKQSYTWYVDFNHYNVTSADTRDPNETPTIISIPCISKSQWMIDGYDYSESLKHDGYGLAQRFWFKPQYTGLKIYMDTYPKSQYINLWKPVNVYNYFNLSYKVDENSILTNYFNITPYLSSNYVEIEVYLTADEYMLLKNGARVRFDDDLYYVTEIEGHDPSQSNPTKLKMIKNTI